jgi:hypothetical protein
MHSGGFDVTPVRATPGSSSVTSIPDGQVSMITDSKNPSMPNFGDAILVGLDTLEPGDQV